MSGLKKLNPKAQLAVAGLWCVLLLAGGWFLGVSPKRAEATDLAGQAEEVQAQIDQNRAAALQAHAPEPIRVADLFRLTRAMPNREDMAGVILQLSRAAEASGIRFTSIAPADQAAATGYTKRNVAIAFTGNFYGLSDFLFRLRNLVAVRGGKLEASGRLFSIEALRFDQGPDLFPQISATLTVGVYFYGTGAPAVAPAPAPATGPTDTTATTTTPAAETPPPAPGATAAGAAG